MKKILVGLLAIALASCGQKKMAERKSLVEADTESSVNLSKDLYSDGRSQMVKTADCRFQVADMNKSKEAIVVSIKKYSGFIESSNLEFQNPMLENHVTIRVLNDYFEDLLNEIIAQASYVNYQKVNSDDVSKEFVDLESRLKTKREVQAKYEEILRKKTGTIEELLKTEKQIGDLQEEIEATVSQIDFLKEKVRYSTIKIEMYQITERQTAEVKKGPTLPDKFATAFVSGLKSLAEVLLAITYLWPFLIIGGVGYFIWNRRKRMVKVG
ncbi:MAG: DUF4349 domain-containing protein [Cyclobacteriaceae bacterium]